MLRDSLGLGHALGNHRPCRARRRTVAVDLFANRGLYRVSITVFSVSFALLPMLFLLGVLGTRLRTAPVVGMLAELSRAPTRADLEQLLRTALGDRAVHH